MSVLDERNVEPDYKELDFLVYPSDEKTIYVKPDANYGGAHQYAMRESLGFSDGKAKYVETLQEIRFVQKNLDGTMSPGLQSEQVAFVLLDRARKLNAVFPSEQNAQMIKGIEMFLDACESRVKDRIDRGVMGDLKK